MELRHLRYLVAVADAGTFTKASETLRVAQPALTRQMRDLERELDATLFQRGARKATLTQAGEVAARMARQVIHDTDRAVKRARLNNRGLAGRCHLSCGPYPVVVGFVARFLHRMQAKYPSIHLVLSEEAREEQWDAVSRAEVDVALGGSPPASYSDLLVETQFVAALNSAVVAPNHPMAGRAEARVIDLVEHNFIAITHFDADKSFERVLMEVRKRGYAPERIREVQGYYSMYAQVLAGHGWAIATEALVKLLPPLVGFPLTDLSVPLRVVRIWRRADKRPVVQTVLSELRQLEQDERQEMMQAAGTLDMLSTAERRVPARLELRHLRSYARVAQQGSMGRAAQDLHITQPALSRQMRDLEFDVGVKLMDRETRGVDLTSVGEEFLSDVLGVLSVADHMRKEVRRAARGVAQTCNLGVVTHPMVRRIVGHALASLAERYPNLDVVTTEVGSPRQTDLLHKSEMDVIIGFAFPMPMQAEDGLVRRRLVDDEICAAVIAKDHPLAKRDVLELADLTDVPFLFGSRPYFTRFYDTVMREFRESGFHPRMDASFNRLLTTYSLCAQGMGWTLGWRSQLTDAPAGTRVIMLRNFSLGWGAEVIFRQDETRSRVLAVVSAITEPRMLQQVGLSTAALSGA